MTAMSHEHFEHNEPRDGDRRATDDDAGGRPTAIVDRRTASAVVRVPRNSTPRS